LLKRSKTDDEIDAAAAGTGTVLVVNDDRDACELIARLLETAGFTARRLNDLDASADALDDGPYLAIIIDSLSCGVTAAFKLLDEIRSGAPDVRHVAVVILAATDTNRLFAYQSGADGFAVRPIHGTELIDLVRSVLARDPDERVEYRRAQLMGGATTA
jgi:two-component system, NtrC family, nitrogen regulation response regulator NtrX